MGEMSVINLVIYIFSFFEALNDAFDASFRVLFFTPYQRH